MGEWCSSSCWTFEDTDTKAEDKAEADSTAGQWSFGSFRSWSGVIGDTVENTCSKLPGGVSGGGNGANDPIILLGEYVAVASCEMPISQVAGRRYRPRIYICCHDIRLLIICVKSGILQLRFGEVKSKEWSLWINPLIMWLIDSFQNRSKNRDYCR